MNEEEKLPGVSIHYGFPNPAADKGGRNLDLNTLLIQRSLSTYLMHVEGDEWQSSGIFHGDIALVDKGLDPYKNDLVIWWKQGRFAISPFHTLPTHVEIWGVVTAIIHRYRRLV